MINYDNINCKVHSCNKCDSAKFRINIVNGSGNINSNIFFIGEAPGYYEDKYGVPFVGDSGELLIKTLNLFNINRDDIYITNIVKCRPYTVNGNRPPTSIEINNCNSYISNELKVGNPKIIVLLGSVAFKTYFNINMPIGNLSGRVIYHKNKYIIPVYHPSYILRNQDNNKILNKHINSFIKIAILYKQFINPTLIFKI